MKKLLAVLGTSCAALALVAAFCLPTLNFNTTNSNVATNGVEYSSQTLVQAVNDTSTTPEYAAQVEAGEITELQAQSLTTLEKFDGEYEPISIANTKTATRDAFTLANETDTTTNTVIDVTGKAISTPADTPIATATNHLETKIVTESNTTNGSSVHYNVVSNGSDTSENSEPVRQAQVDGFSLITSDSVTPTLTIASIDGEEATNTEETICAKVYAAYDAVSESVDLTEDNVTYGDFCEAMNLIAANPEYYWASSSFTFTFVDSDADGEADTTEQIQTLYLSYVVDSSEVSKVKESTEAAITYALSWVDTETASDFEIAQALHDYIVRTCTYNEYVAYYDTAVSTARTAYGALVEGSAVCQGYALAYKLLLTRAGIPAIFIPSSDMNHAWNMVKIDGSWYHVDTTWDDPLPDAGFDAEVSHEYFLRSDSSFTSLEHYGWQAAYTTPTDDYANREYEEYKGPYSDGTQSGYIVDWTTCGTCEWSIDNAGCLVIRPFNGVSGTLDDWSGSEGCEGLPPWYIQRYSILSVRIESGVVALTCYQMFFGCANAATFDLSGLDTSKVTNMSLMFYDCVLPTILNVSGFDTSNVVNISYMFLECEALSSLDVSNFNTSQATNMNGMFCNCFSLTSIDVSNFDTSSANGMADMFNGCCALTSLDVSNFDTSQATTIGGMFAGCELLNSIDVSNFDTTKVTSMSGTFQDCPSLKSLNLANFNTSKVVDMEYMFDRCSSLTSLDFSSFDTSQVTNMAGMFNECSSLTSLDLSGFNTSSVTGTAWENKNIAKDETGMDSMFAGCESLTSLNIANFDTSNVASMYNMFAFCKSLTTLDISHFNTSQVTDMGRMFYGCQHLNILNVSNFDTGKVVRMTYMFGSCDSLTSLDVSKFKTSLVPDMSYMFASCLSLVTLDVSNFDTSNVTNMEEMFWGCGSLTSLNSSKFNTSKVTNMCKMFEGCSSLTSLDVSNFDTSNVVNMNGMFNGCSSLTSLDVSDFNTSVATDMTYLFQACKSLTFLDLSNFDTSNVSSMKGMFNACSNLHSVALSNNFSFCGSNTSPLCTLPTPSGDNYTGKWINCSDGKSYAASEIPNYTAATYVAEETVGWTTCGTCEWSIDSNGALVIQPINSSSEGTLDNWGDSQAPWVNGNTRYSIKTAEFKGTVHTLTASSMFDGCTSLISIDLSGLDTSDTTNFNRMFSDCYRLTSLDLSLINTSNALSMNAMFDSCSSLNLVTLSENFSFFGSAATQLCILPTPSGDNFTGKWVSSADSIAYAAADIPSNTAATYTAQKESPKWQTSGTCEWMINNEGLLTIRPLSENTTGTLINWEKLSRNAPWSDQKLSIKSVVVEKGVIAQTCKCMFKGCSELKSADLTNLDISNVTNMGGMFNGCSALESADLTGFSASNVTNMSYMFNGCSALESINLSSLTPSTTTKMDYMLRGCSMLTSITLPAGMNLSNTFLHNTTWEDSAGNSFTTTSDMIAANTKRDTGAITYKGALLTSGWNQSGTCEWLVDDDGLLVVRPIGNSAAGTLEDWETGSGIAPWLHSGKTITTARFDGTVFTTSGSEMFSGLNHLTAIDLSGLDTSAVTNMYYMFNSCFSLTSLDLSNFNTSSVTDMTGMFNCCYSLASLDLSSFDTSNVVHMKNMFYSCSSLTSVNLSSFDTSNTWFMSDMFFDCSNLQSVTLGKNFNFNGTDSKRLCSLPTPVGSNLTSKWISSVDGIAYDAADIPSNVAATYTAQKGESLWITSGTCEWRIDRTDCLVIRPIDGVSGKLKDWSSEEYMGVPWYSARKLITSVRVEPGVSAATTQYMFYNHEALTSVDLSELDTSSVTDMSDMFSNCGSLTSLNLTGIDTSSVTYMRWMFVDCSSLTSINLSDFNTSLVTDMSLMFYGCSSLTSLDLSNFNTSSAENMDEMFWNCSNLQSVTLGEKFSFSGAGEERLCSLPTPSGEDLTGKWVSSADGAAYDAANIPSNIAATYTAEAHVHKLTKTDEVPASCVASGTRAYWTCEKCGCSFSDADATSQIATPEVIEALNHSLRAVAEVPATCTEAGTHAYWVCGTCHELFSDEAGATQIDKPLEISPAGHKLTKTDEVAASCVASGTRAYWTCEKCDCLFSDADATTQIATPEIIEALGHSLRAVAEVPATCTEAGTHAYWVCDTCHELFSDADGATPIEEPATIESTGHNCDAPTITFSDDGKSATATWACKNNAEHRWTADCEVTSRVTIEATLDDAGTTEYTATASANEELGLPEGTATTTRIDIPALGRTYGPCAITFAEDGKTATASWTCTADPTDVKTQECTVTSQVTQEASCTTPGTTTYTATSAGNEELGLAPGTLTTTREDIPALGHDLTTIPAVEPTCEKPGLTAGETCARCSHTVEQQVIPALGHNFPTQGGTCERCGTATTLLKEVTGAGHFRITYTPTTAVEKGCVTFNGKPMAYDKSANVWTIVVESAPTQSTIDAFAVDESATAFVLPSFGEERYGDINSSGKTNVVDAQLAYDLACGRYAAENEPAYCYLLADVNIDDYIDSADAFAIQHAIHYGWSKEEAVNQTPFQRKRQNYRVLTSQ